MRSRERARGGLGHHNLAQPQSVPSEGSQSYRPRPPSEPRSQGSAPYATDDDGQLRIQSARGSRRSAEDDGQLRIQSARGSQRSGSQRSVEALRLHSPAHALRPSTTASGQSPRSFDKRSSGSSGAQAAPRRPTPRERPGTQGSDPRRAHVARFNVPDSSAVSESPKVDTSTPEAAAPSEGRTLNDSSPMKESSGKLVFKQRTARPNTKLRLPPPGKEPPFKVEDFLKSFREHIGLKYTNSHRAYKQIAMQMGDDGVLDQNGFEKAASRMGLHTDRPTMEKIFKEVPKGPNGVISYAEFANHLFPSTTNEVTLLAKTHTHRDAKTSVHHRALFFPARQGHVEGVYNDNREAYSNDVLAATGIPLTSSVDCNFSCVPYNLLTCREERRPARPSGVQPLDFSLLKPPMKPMFPQQGSSVPHNLLTNRWLEPNRPAVLRMAVFSKGNVGTCPEVREGAVY
mmetsp:Transcript_13844/g.32104  ORF Transcript_13844/g.32104 Transcript_13844/m.32104 type:complete len:457 (-) Transcript_13844:546-1916(-)